MDDFRANDLIRYTYDGAGAWRHARLTANGSWAVTGINQTVSWAWLTDRWLMSKDVKIEFLGTVIAEGPYADQDSTKYHRLMWTDALKPKKEERNDTKMRRFNMTRGEKMIAVGVEFWDGTVVVRWTTSMSSTVIWGSMTELTTVANTHETTTINWIDEEAKN